jgi:AmmeMemoRadiSam system protein B
MKQRAERIWESPLAGRWYSADPEALRRELAALAPQPAPAPVPGVCAVIVPHAGYAYSGKAAMAAYARLDPDAYDRAVVIGPSHAVAMPNRLSALEATHIRTPLGDCEIDLPFLQRLRETPFVVHEPRAHAREHSDQIQLPLLQVVFGDRPLRVVPLVCGWFEPAAANAFGETLRSLLDSRTLLVISTDFTHYGPSFDYVPFTANVSERLRELDHRVFARITAGDAAGYRQVLQATGATVCGENPLAILIAVAGPAATISEVAYDQSGRMTGDWENSVSYLSALANW